MSVLKKILKVLLYILIVLLIPFAAEWILNFYDTQFNSMTRPNAILTVSEGVHKGSNQRKFKEERFRSQDLGVTVHFKSLPEIEIQAITNRISGKFTVRTAEEYNKKQSGKSFKFKLKENISVAENKVNTKYGVDDINYVVNYDVECSIAPESFTEELLMDALLRREFEKGEEVYFDIDFDGRIPPNTEFIFTYSKSPRSLLRGTFLYGIDDKIYEFLKKSLGLQ